MGAGMARNAGAQLLVLSVTVVTLLLSGCFFGGGGDEEEDQGITGDALRTVQAQQPAGTPTPAVPNPTPPPTPTLGPTPVVQSLEQARDLVWIFLGQCFPLDPDELQANQVQQDWFVRTASRDLPQQYGLWKVNAAVGSFEPQDPVARDWRSYVDSDCSPEERPASLLATPAPLPTATPSPVSTPVAQSAAEASNLVWVFLGKCLSIDLGQLRATQVRGDWFVKATSESPQEFGLWKVAAATGNLEPQDPLARGLESFVSSQCSPQLFATLFPPTPTPISTPVPTPTPTPTPIPTPTPVPSITTPADAVAAVWGFVVPCATSIDLGDLEAQCDPRSRQFVVSPNPPKDTDGRREDSGRGWVRELQGRWPGVLG